MKRIKLMMGLTAAVCCFISTSHAILVMSGTGILPSTTSVPTAATTLSVDYSVDLTAGIYTYAYTVKNPLGDSTSPNQFSVSFNALLNGTSVIATSGGLASFVNPGSSVFWFLAPVAPGASSGVLSFTSRLAPTLGAAGANDHNPPAPWSTLAAGGVPVAVPVPEPTTVIAGALLLLPFGASTLRFIRRSRGTV